MQSIYTETENVCVRERERKSVGRRDEALEHREFLHIEGRVIPVFTQTPQSRTEGPITFLPSKLMVVFQESTHMVHNIKRCF